MFDLDHRFIIVERLFVGNRNDLIFVQRLGQPRGVLRFFKVVLLRDRIGICILNVFRRVLEDVRRALLLRHEHLRKHFLLSCFDFIFRTFFGFPENTHRIDRLRRFPTGRLADPIADRIRLLCGLAGSNSQLVCQDIPATRRFFFNRHQDGLVRGRRHRRVVLACLSHLLSLCRGRHLFGAHLGVSDFGVGDLDLCFIRHGIHGLRCSLSRSRLDFFDHRVRDLLNRFFVGLFTGGFGTENFRQKSPMIFLLFGHEYAFLFGDVSTASGPERGHANLWNLDPQCNKSRAIAKVGPPALKKGLLFAGDRRNQAN